MQTKLLIFLLSILITRLAAAETPQRDDRVSRKVAENPDKEFVVYKFEIKEPIAAPALRLTQMAFEEAEAQGADFILIHMNTYGGQVDIADSIRTRVMQSRIPVITFVDNNAASAGALIAIASDRIYMRMGSNMGAATVVDQAGEMAPEKLQSYMSSMMRSTAEAKGRNPEIAQAMVDPAHVVEGIDAEGEVLTFTASEALRWGFSEGVADSPTEVLELAGLANHRLVEQQLTGIDRFINFLINPVVAGILIMLIIGGIYFELQTPGLGFPILEALTAALLYFAPLYLEGLAANWEILIFIIGLVLIAVELFVLPGFGVSGILGILFIISGLALAMVGNVGPDFSNVPAREIFSSFLLVIIAFFISISASIFLGAKLLTARGVIGNTLALNTVQDTSAGFSTANESMRSLVGKTGMAYTVLRPSGKVEIEDNLYDATALSGFIEKGVVVKVVKYETSQIFVVKA